MMFVKKFNAFGEGLRLGGVMEEDERQVDARARGRYTYDLYTAHEHDAHDLG